MTVAKCIYGNNKPLLNKNRKRTIEAQFVQKLKNNEARPKCVGSYLKKRVQQMYELMSPAHAERFQITVNV